MLSPLMSLLKGLRNGSFERVQRGISVGSFSHTLTIECTLSGYRLTRVIIDTWHDSSLMLEPRQQVCDFRYLTDLFAAAKRDGFFEEVNPYALDWRGYSKPKPRPMMFFEEEFEENVGPEWEYDLPEDPEYDRTRDWYEGSYGEDEEDEDDWAS